MKIRAENHPEVFIKESDFLCPRQSHQLLPGSAARSCKFLLPMTLHHISEATEFFFLLPFFFFSGSQLFTGKKSWRIIKITITTTEQPQRRQAEKPFQCNILSGAWLWRPRLALELLVLDLHSISTPDGNNYLLAWALVKKQTGSKVS